MVVKRLRDAEDLPFFNIRDHGAVVDGVTDDTPAVELAKAAALTAGGGIIHFPAGITALKSNGTQLDGVGEVGHLIFQGEGSRSKIRFSGLTNSSTFYLANISAVTYRDLAFIGLDDGAGVSSATPETSWLIFLNAFILTTLFERCNFYGLGSSGTLGVFYFGNTRPMFRDCLILGCAAPNGAVVVCDAAYGTVFDNTHFVDYGLMDGISYAKGAVLGISDYWVDVSNVPALNSQTLPRALSLINVGMDEACSVANVRVVGTADDSVYLENFSTNGMVSSASPALRFSTLHELVVRNAWCGYNVGAYTGIECTDVANVDIDGLIFDDGATDIKLLGTTKRLKLRNCQDVAITNTAGAFIDADQAMPNTASASALAPKGKITKVTGTIGVTSITMTNLKEGDEFTLWCEDALTITEGNNMKMAGNFSSLAGDFDNITFKVVGSNCIEVGRSNN